MSWWDSLTHPINQALNSNVFKAAFPVQALGQEAVKFGSGLAGMNHGHQYAIGGGTGGAIAGGSALMGGGAGAGGGMTPYMPTSAPNMGAAGTTLGGGGMSSPLNLGGSAGMGGMQAGGAAQVSPISKALQMMRMMPQGGQQQQPMQQSPMNQLERIYAMYPALRPRLGGHNVI